MYKGYVNSVLIKSHFNDPKYFGSDYSYKAITSNANYLWLTGNYSTLHADYQNNDIKVGGSRDVVYGEAGNDFFVTNLSGAYSTLYGGEGNDTVFVDHTSDGVQAYGEAGNDTFFVANNSKDINFYGGTGDDLFWFLQSSSGIVVEGGEGSNTYRFDPYYIDGPYHNDIIITDLSSDDTIEYFADYGYKGDQRSDGTELGWSIDSDSGFVVLYDNNWGGFFNVTLEGVTDIREVADVKYNSTKGGTKTLGEIFKIPGGGKVKLNSLGTKATILDTYTDTNFKTADYGSKLKTVDGSAASQDLYITANGLANKIIGSDFDDTIDGGKGNDILMGGEGADVFIYKNGDGKNTILDYDEEDKIKIASGTLSDISVSGDDLVLTVGKGSITIKDGADKEITIVDSKGKEKIYPDDFKQAVSLNTSGTAAELTDIYEDESFYFEDHGKKLKTVDASAVQYGLEIIANTLANAITGTDYNDTISGDAGNDKIWGGKANDKLYGDAGNDSLSGGAGADILSGDAGNDSLSGGAGNDTLSGGTGNDKLLGGAGNDSLSGGDGADTLSGDAGNDKLTGGKGNDTFVFSGGKDTISDYTAGDDKVSVASSLGKGKFSVSGKNVVMTYGSNVLTITNGLNKKITFNDTTAIYKTTGIFNSDSTAVTLPAATKSFDASAKTYSKVVTVDSSAASAKVTIKGNAKANYFIAGNNGSSVTSGNGNDKLYGGTGADILYGGAGKDSLSGGSGNDKLYGDADNDSILGDAGNDSIWGGNGNDTLRGNNGNDKLYGQADADKLYGGAGKDSLWGGKGNDSLWGDAGADVFYYEKGDGKDTIYGFENSDMLKITGTFSTPTYNKSKKEVYFKVDSTANAITLKDFTASTFNVNGTNYKISGTKLVKK